MKYRDIALLAAVALVAAACGVTGLAQLPTILSSYADPVGDTAAGAPPTVYDITKIVTRRIDNSPFGSYDTLQIEVTFNQPVVLQPAGSATGDAAGTQLLPEIAIDTDQDVTTGISYGCGTVGFSMPGGDYFLFSWEGVGRLANGNYNIHLGAAGRPVTGEATPSVSGHVLTFNIPLSALGNDDGATRVGVFAGNWNSGSLKETDCGPNGGGMVITRTPGAGVGVQR